MAETQVAIGLKHQTEGDTDWETPLNEGIIEADVRLTQKYDGSPVGNVAGYWVGQVCWDFTNKKFYICTTIGAVGVAVWESGDLVKLSVQNSYTKQQLFAAQTASGSGAIAWDLDAEQVMIYTLTGDATLSNPTNPRAGGFYTFFVKQNAVGGWTFGLGSDYHFPDDIDPDMPLGATDAMMLTFFTDGTFMYGVEVQVFTTV